MKSCSFHYLKQKCEAKKLPIIQLKAGRLSRRDFEDDFLETSLI